MSALGICQSATDLRHDPLIRGLEILCGQASFPAGKTDERLGNAFHSLSLYPSMPRDWAEV